MDSLGNRIHDWAPGAAMNCLLNPLFLRTKNFVKPFKTNIHLNQRVEEVVKEKNGIVYSENKMNAMIIKSKKIYFFATFFNI